MNSYFFSTLLDYVDAHECSFDFELPELSLSVDRSAHPTIPTSVLLGFLASDDHELVDWYTLSLTASGAKLALLEETYSHRIDWKALAYNSHADEQFWLRMSEKFPELVEFGILAFSKALGETFWSRYHDRVTMERLSWNPCLPESFWRRDDRLATANWTALSCNTQLSIPFWKQYYTCLDAQITCMFNTTLDESFWRWMVANHPDDVVWPALSRCSKLSSEFWEEHFDHIRWHPLCQFNTTVGEQFWERHVDHIQWPRLALNESVPFSFFARHSQLQHHVLVDSTPFWFIKQHIDDYDGEDVINHPDCPWRKYPEFQEYWYKSPRIVNELVRDELVTFLKQ